VRTNKCVAGAEAITRECKCDRKWNTFLKKVGWFACHVRVWLMNTIYSIVHLGYCYGFAAVDNGCHVQKLGTAHWNGW